MFRKVAASLLLSTLCLTSAAHGQTLHVISAADSNDANIGTGSAANSKGLQSYASIVSVITKLSLNFTEIRGDKFICTDITKAVQDLQAKPDDVIIFYYSGHGFAPDHEPGKPGVPVQSKFPWFFCNPAAGRPNLEAIGRELGNKGARLTITVADTCNVIIPVAEEPLTARGVIDEQIRAMFLNYKGNILITSSKRGQFSWYYPTGGVFTTKLLGLLRNPPEADRRKLWDAVLSNAREKIVVRTPGGPVEQYPEVPVPADLVFVDTR